MTKETKIGLLVGLAFIILFAIILSEKGARRGVDTPSDMVAGIVDGVSDSGAETPLQNDGRLAIEQQLPPALDLADATSDRAPISETDPTEQLVAQDIPEDGSQLPDLSPALVNLLNEPNLDTTTDSVTAWDETEPIDTSEFDSSGTALASTGTGTTTPDAGIASGDSTATLSDIRIPPRAGGLSNMTANTPTNTTTPRTRSQPRARPSPSRTIAAIHQVRPGECLGKIAARYYGRSTPARETAIFEFNRDVLNRIDSVRAGDKLRIPALAGTAAAGTPSGMASNTTTNTPAARTDESESLLAVTNLMRNTRDATSDGAIRIPLPVNDSASRTLATRSTPTAAPTRRTSTRRPAFRWYRVRQDDSLFKIAKRELGNGGRFQELYTLNRDRLASPDRLKNGMKIRIPLTAGEETVSVSSANLYDD